MIKPVWNPFSQYADQQEKRVDKILKKIAFLGVFEAQSRILELMNQNLVVLDLWLEARFKGYKYLTRSARKKMYKNSEKIVDALEKFIAELRVNDATITAQLRRIGLSIPQTAADMEKLRRLYAIMLFLSPGSGRYEYLEGASFGKLLKDVEKQKLIGDCNQIVTLYTYLFSVKYPLNELKIKLLPGHVCLHFKGIDIEATAGAFANYQENARTLPITELISTNLLDVSDFRDKQIKVHSRDFLKAAQLANHLSSDRSLVSSNLKISYHNVAIDALRENDFESALFFLKTSGIITEDDRSFEANILNNATIFYVKQHNYKKARYYAEQANKSDLLRYVDEQEGFYFYEQNALTKARALFQKVGNLQMVKATYSKEYNQIQAKVAGLNERSAMRSHKGDYQKMYEIAQKIGDQSLIENIKNVLNQL